MRCKTYEINALKNYKYVVILSESHGKIILSRHKERTTWETQGGHIEVGETPLEAAKRELFEESGAVDFDIEPICDYRAWDENTLHGANGVVFHAVIQGNTAQSRHIAQKSLAIRQYACGISRQSAEKSDNAPYAQALCGVASAIFRHSRK